MNYMNEEQKKVDKLGRTHIEITVVLKNSEQTYRHKFSIYDDVLMSPQAALISDLIEQATQAFRAEVDDIVIKATMVVQ